MWTASALLPAEELNAERVGAVAVLAMAACGGQSLNSVNHIVVIYLENHSFDNLYGEFAVRKDCPFRRRRPRSRSMPTARSTLRCAADQHVDAPAGLALSGESAEHVLQYRPVPPGDAESAGPRAPLLPPANPDRRRQDGSVRADQRRCRPRHGTYHTAQLPLAPRPRHTLSAITSFMRRSEVVPEPCLARRRREPDLPQRTFQHRGPGGCAGELGAWQPRQSDAGLLRSEYALYRQHSAPFERARESAVPNRRSPPSRRADAKGSIGPGTPAAGTMRWRATLIRRSSFITSPLPTSRTTPTGRRPRRPT